MKLQSNLSFEPSQTPPAAVSPAAGLSLYALKPRFRTLLTPVAGLLVRRGVTANQVTSAACLLSVALGLLLAFVFRERWMLLALPVFLLVRMALNAIDGVMAKEFGQRSALGAYLNELGDVLSDAFLYLPFALLGVFDPLWIAAVIVLSVICEMTGVVAVMAGASRRYDGPLGKSDRALVFGALGLWLGAGNQVPAWMAQWLPCCLFVLLALTIVNRVKQGLEEYAHTTRAVLHN